MMKVVPLFPLTILKQRLNDYLFPRGNIKSKNKYEKQKELSTKRKPVDTIVIIATITTSVILSIKWLGLIVAKLYTGVECFYHSVIKVLMSKLKKDVFKQKQLGRAQQTIISVDVLENGNRMKKLTKRI